MWLIFNLASHHLKQEVNYPTEDISCSISMAEGWDVPEQGRRPRHRWFEQRDRSGGLLRHGTSPFTPQCVTGGVESPHVLLVAYCRVRQEAHSWRILSCPTDSEATMIDQDCNDTSTNRSVIIHENGYTWNNIEARHPEWKRHVCGCFESHGGHFASLYCRLEFWCFYVVLGLARCAVD